MGKQKICMIGWEFPPFLNGGLGVACQGLAEALAPLTELRLIVPKTTYQYQAEGWKLIGMQGRTIAAIYETEKRTELEWMSRVNLKYVDVELSGYERMERRVEVQEEEESFLVEKVFYEEELMRPEGVFLLRELYGPDLVDRVIEFAELVVEEAMKEDFDVIYAHDWMTFLAGLQLKARSDKPLVLHIHSLEYDRAGPASKSWIYELERHAMEQADKVVAVSAYTAEIIRNHYEIPEDQIQVIHNAVQPYPSYRLNPPFEGALIVYLGRLTGQKGPEYFFEAARLLLEEDIPVQFVIAGRGDLIDTLVQLTNEKHLGEHIHFTGFLEPDRARDLLAMADVYVMPSVSEPFGLAALEAAQMQVPCVITRQSGVGEVLTGALRTDYWNTEEMAELMKELLENHPLRRSVIHQQQKDLEGVSWNHTSRKLLTLFDELS